MNPPRLLVLHARSPLHVGTGRGEGLVDLPIARDVATRHPILPGSGLKGPIRAAAPESDRAAVFGPEVHNAHDYASAVRFSDARLLALPVPSDHGTFAWVTSPFVLARLARDASGIVEFAGHLPELRDDQVACVDGSALVDDNLAYLDGQRFRHIPLHEVWAEQVAQLVFPDDPLWHGMLRARLAVVTDNTFDLLAQTGTDVRARIRLSPETGTVADGGLWYEESVPTESVFVGVVHFVGNRHADPARAERVVAATLAQGLTLGGGKTTGMGLVAGRLHGGSP